MRLLRMLCFFFSLSMLLPGAAHAQWTVFDPSNYATALQEFHQMQQSYTTALQTRDQIISAYKPRLPDGSDAPGLGSTV